MNPSHPADLPDPHAVLGVAPGASTAEITAAYRRAVRECHPDTPHPDRERLAAVITAYRHLRDHLARQPTEPHQRPTPGHDIHVRVHPRTTPPEPDVRAGPVHRHPHRKAGDRDPLERGQGADAPTTQRWLRTSVTHPGEAQGSRVTRCRGPIPSSPRGWSRSTPVKRCGPPRGMATIAVATDVTVGPHTDSRETSPSRSPHPTAPRSR
ncbi:J domain-containing protein [Amycolatopsis sp. NPDC050768]|uniref:J domain-containing protein n=1 Tax=unclassified Amycolatopsis TaxID=2618356 RepID=UPI0033ED71A8